MRRSGSRVSRARREVETVTCLSGAGSTGRGGGTKPAFVAAVQTKDRWAQRPWYTKKLGLYSECWDLSVFKGTAHPPKKRENSAFKLKWMKNSNSTFPEPHGKTAFSETTEEEGICLKTLRNKKIQNGSIQFVLWRYLHPFDKLKSSLWGCTLMLLA